jgi:hypothetical protein
MPKFRKKPVVIEAVQWDGKNFESIALFAAESINPRGCYLDMKNNNVLTIETLEGNHVASIGDWIIMGVKGELYPCKPDIFEATYEAIKP